MKEIYKEIHGDLIQLAQEGNFNVIVHGCNCFNNMGRGIAPQIAKSFGANKFLLENKKYKGDINKLGSIDWANLWKDVKNNYHESLDEVYDLIVVNAYTQYGIGLGSLDYQALELCMRKINHIFKGKHIGLPKIGAGLAGGNWETIKYIIQKELIDCYTTIVIYEI